MKWPYSGNPGILNEEEFGESFASKAQDGELNVAEKLGLMPMSDTPQYFLLELRASLPLPKKPDSAAEPRSTGNVGPASSSSKMAQEETGPLSAPCSKLEDLPEGPVGKILVYKSGKVKMKMGDALFDVSPGANVMFPQEVVAGNTREKHCCYLGEVTKHAVITHNP